MSDWTPTDAEVMQFFTDGTDQLYSLTATPAYWNGKAAFLRWLTEHDRQVAEKAWTDGWEEGQFYEEVLRTGRIESQNDIKSLQDNPYRKRKS